MSITWGSRWRSFAVSGRNLQIGWLVTAAIVALYFGAFRPREGVYGISNSKAGGLAAAESPEPLASWHETRVAGIIGGVPASADKSFMRADGFLSSPQALARSADALGDRKMVRSSTLDLVVKHPAEAAEQVRQLAEREGGFLVNSEVRGDQDATGATLTIRVPAPRFEQVRAEIRRMGLRVENERIEAQDVTRQYTDQEANLRNLRAEEQQYLLILKQARTVKDTLEVSEKLSDVCGQIEQQQAEFSTLSKQIETVAIMVSLRAEAETRVLGLNWRPLYQIKLALRDGLDGLTTYFSSMAGFVCLLPTIVLWLGTILFGAAVAWKLLRWAGRRWFGLKRTEAAAQG